MSVRHWTEVKGRTFFAIAWEVRRRWAGLIRVVARRYHSRRPSVPFGWTVTRAYDRNEWLVMPLWLYPAWYLSQHWSRLVFTPFMRLGVYDLDEGDYYVNGRWTWAQDWN